ncbi:diguanylate cyclase [Actinotalea ferrariae CF5-4]|uniref:Diguanylate cyclase n=1 Tax=Actinotalea ferrariae CF5-4 TaxID=948458 RepID=A0A021VQF9_9CELL|nr:GGDEF and EAL domain-containing protein [Actinotalea ferrariae]EYR63361.1 diguanylate cyclase [Actinotalea ferrariae CF5-4]
MATSGPRGDRDGLEPWQHLDVPSRSWLPRGARRPGRRARAAVDEGPGSGAVALTGEQVRSLPGRAPAPDDGASRRPLVAPGGPVFLLLLALAVFGLAVTAVSFAHETGSVSAWWPAAGVGLLAFLATPPGRRWTVPVVVLVATGAANALAGRPLVPSVGYGLSNMLDVIVTGWWLVRGRNRAVLETVDDVVRLLVATGLGVLALGLGVGTTAALTGYGSFIASAGGAAASHAAAIVVMVPLGLAARHHGPRRSAVEVAAQSSLLATVVVLVYAFPTTLPLGYALVPALVWGALRFAPRAVATQLLAVGAAMTTLTALGGGPIAGADLQPQVTALFVQAHLLTLAVVALPLSVAANTRRHVIEGLAASERLFRQGFSESLVGMLLLRLCRGDGTPVHTVGGLDVVEVNAVAARLLGEPEERLLGTCWTSTLDEHDRGLLAEVVEGMVRGRVSGWRGEVEIPTPQGTRFLELALSPLPRSVGDGMFVAQMIDVTARREAEERLTAQALQDALTGLANRTLLRDRIGLALALLPDDPADDDAAAAATTAVLFCDLDDFKHVNDSAGHTVGDALLVEVGRRLRGLLGPGDLAARPGGDEFVLLRPVVGPGEAEALADQVIDALGRPIEVDGHVFAVGVSIGVVHGRRGSTAEDLLRDADAAMYAAKAGGKRRAVVYSDVHRERALRAVRLEAELRRALELGELRLHLQPVVDIRTGATIAAEALVRWQHPQRGLLPPGEWLDVAERCGLMPELGAWVLDEACTLAAAWTDDAPRPVTVHVNVSARQLEQEGFVDVVRGALVRSGLAPERLVLEFTETHLEEVSDALLQDLVSLRESGIGLAADDYGTGYSPLTRIIELPLSMIKIDKRFVGDMLEDVRSRAIVTTLVRLGQSLGLEVVAEGVETPQQAVQLSELGCASGQGYLWSRPVPPEEFTARLLPGTGTGYGGSYRAPWALPVREPSA